jgi:hypothetical protein
MTLDEFRPIAERINRLWPPAMDVPIAEEYHAVLEGFPVDILQRAVTAIAKAGPRSYRPDVGTLYETASALLRAHQMALPAPEVDPLSAEEHRQVLAEVARRQTAEHRRRHEAVVDLLRATGYRVPLAELPALMATSRSTADEFDRQMSRHRATAYETRRSA